MEGLKSVLVKDKQYGDTYKGFQAESPCEWWTTEMGVVVLEIGDWMVFDSLGQCYALSDKEFELKFEIIGPDPNEIKWEKE